MLLYLFVTQHMNKTQYPETIQCLVLQAGKGRVNGAQEEAEGVTGTRVIGVKHLHHGGLDPDQEAREIIYGGHLL